MKFPGKMRSGGDPCTLCPSPGNARNGGRITFLEGSNSRSLSTKNFVLRLIRMPRKEFLVDLLSFVFSLWLLPMMKKSLCHLSLRIFRQPFGGRLRLWVLGFVWGLVLGTWSFRSSAA